MTGSSLLLDVAIRDWVVLPMLLLLALVDIGRQSVQQLIKSKPAPYSKKKSDEQKHRAILMSAQRLRANCSHIDEEAFIRRKVRLTRTSDGLLREKVPGPGNPMSNPNMLVDMLKNQGTYMLPNFVLMNFISSFFTGFVCLKVPFPLPSNGFKIMLQRDIDISALDVSYVSSVSWYFLITFGMQGAYQLLLGGGVEMQDPRMMMQMGNSQAGFDARGAFAAELAALSVCRHTAEDAPSYADERRLLRARFPSTDADLLDLAKLTSH